MRHGLFAICVLAGAVLSRVAIAQEVSPHTNVGIQGNNNISVIGDRNAVTAGAVTIDLGAFKGSAERLLNELKQYVVKEQSASVPFYRASKNLADARLKLLLDDNPTEVELVHAKIGRWLEVQGPTLDITLKNTTKRTATEISFDLVGDNGNRLSQSSGNRNAFKHYSIRGGQTGSLPATTISTVSEALHLRELGLHIVAAGTSPNIERDCPSGEYAVGPDMPCRPRPPSFRAFAFPVAVIIKFFDIFGGKHTLYTAIFVYAQPKGQGDESPMTSAGD